MVHCFLASPFADAARAEQYAAVLAALQADAATDSLLLSNLVLEDGAAPLDAVVIQPHSITLLVLVPAGGRLSIPALGAGRWLLDGAPLPTEEFDNPFAQFRQQKAALEAWLRPRFSPGQVNLRFITGIGLFARAVAFAPDVEPALNSTAATGFVLLSNAADLPRCLPQLGTLEIDLTPKELADWAAELAAFAETQQAPAGPAADAAALAGDRRPAGEAPTDADAAPGTAPAPAGAPVGLGQRLLWHAWAVWRWLGAADVPDDLAYGYNPAAAARRAEKQQLERLRQQLQADLSRQMQALEAREAERERSIAQLRAELARVSPVAPEVAALEARLAAETREKDALKAAMQTSRTESAARNQEIGRRIQQLVQRVDRLGRQAVGAPGVGAAVAALGTLSGRAGAARTLAGRVGAMLGPGVRRGWAWARRRPRVAVVAAGLATLGLGAWGLRHVADGPPVPFQEKGRWGYADASGQPVVPAQYTAASPFVAGQAVVAKDGAYGLIDEDGQEVVPLAYDALNPYAGGYARARMGDAYTFLDDDGQEFAHYYFNARDFAEGYAAVLDHRGWHYISGPTEPDTPPVVFAEAYSFAEGLARVKLPDGYTYITPAYLADPSRGTKPFGRYEQATDFADGKARVTQGGRSFAIDKAGDEVK